MDEFVGAQGSIEIAKEETTRTTHVTSPISSTSILSRPTGPSEVLTILATAIAARTFADLTSSADDESREPPRNCTIDDEKQMCKYVSHGDDFCEGAVPTPREASNQSRKHQVKRGDHRSWCLPIRTWCSLLLLGGWWWILAKSWMAGSRILVRVCYRFRHVSVCHSRTPASTSSR
jgi:hypothetical protein